MANHFRPGVLIALMVAMVLTAACGGSAPSPTAAPAKPAATTAAAPTTAPAKPAATTAAAPTTAAAAPTTAAAPAQVVKLKFATGGNPPDPSYITPFIARDAGFFKQNGLDVDVQSLQGDELVTKALASGDIDIADDGSAAVYAVIGQGAKMKVIVSGTPKVDQVVLARADVKTLKDFEGKSFAVSAPGSFSDASSRLVLQKSGVDVSKVNFLPLGGQGNRGNALVAGQVDGTAVSALRFAQIRKQDPSVHQFVAFADVIPDFLYTMMMARTDWLDKNQDVATRFAKSIIQASRYIETNEQDSINIMLKVVPNSTQEELKTALDGLIASHVYGVDGGLSRKAFDYTNEELVAMKSIKAPLKYEDVIDTRYVDAAMKDLGPFKK